MLPTRCVLVAGLAMMASVSIAAPKDKEATSEGNIEGLTCFQKGQPVFKAQDRVREFVATSSMPLVAEVSLGQVRETRVRLYASEHADVVCVTTNKD
jgi:hypothetical protein